jgi:hypothetical protein
VKCLPRRLSSRRRPGFLACQLYNREQLVPSEPNTVNPEAAPPGPSPGGALDFLKAAGEAATVVTGLSFISGWLYWSTYYSSFGLNPLELDFSAAVLSVSPIQVVVRDWQSDSSSVGLALVAAIVAGLLLTGLFVHFRVNGYRRAGTMLVLIAIGMCAAAFKLGRHDGALDLGCSSRLPDVAFVTNTQDALTAGNGAASCVVDSELSCKLVLHANSIYHYFTTPEVCDAGAEAAGGGFATAELPDSQVRLIRVQRRTAW